MKAKEKEPTEFAAIKIHYKWWKMIEEAAGSKYNVPQYVVEWVRRGAKLGRPRKGG